MTDPAKWVMMPAMAKRRRVDLDRRIAELTDFAETTQLNRAEYRDASIGIVCSGVSYQHVREALPEASDAQARAWASRCRHDRLRDFADKVDELYVVEEADAYLERSLRQLGIDVQRLCRSRARRADARCDPRGVRPAEPAPRDARRTLPPRPPLMCPGCPHRPVFDALRKKRAVVTGDIGCYTLGALTPLAAMDTCVGMGASIGMAHGAELVGGVGERPVVAVIGDSTFAHSGITGLMNTVYNGGDGHDR